MMSILGTLVAVGTGITLVVIPEPASTLTGLAILAGTFGVAAGAIKGGS
ncbi:MAG: hypothetical protein KDA24_24670 [Deltaproteobacteria bacterium]|nr:hypothetical protein [Deltaproteobacteria bacterium]